MTRTIVITGATGDIAQEIVKRLPDDQLILLSRNREKLEKLYGHLSNIIFLENDEVCERDLPEVDILINNAGFGIFKNFQELTKEEITEQFQVNTLTAIQNIHIFKPSVQVINIVSIAGKLPSAKSSAYVASKAALIAFSDVLRMENQKIIVTTVNTGPVKTKFHANNQNYLKKVGKNVISPDFVAEKIVKNLGKRKREVNLPWQLAILSKIRAIFPSFIDFLAVKFFDFK